MFFSFIKKIVNLLKSYSRAVNKVVSPRVGIGSTSAGIGSTSAGIGSTSDGIGSTSAGIGSTSAGIGSTSQPFSFSLHCSKQIDDLLDESMSIDVNGKVYISQDHAASSYMRNEDLWCGDLDITCVSPWNSSGGHKKAGTLVTPRHVIGAAHYEYSVGAVVRFVEKDDTVHDRTVTGKARHPNYKPHYPDLTIYTLDSDLPSTITPCNVMPSNYSDYLDNTSGIKIPCLGLDQEEKALIIDWHVGGRMRTPTDSKRRIFHENKIGGDSGNPAFLVFEGELVLVTVWTYGGAGGGTPVADHISDINAMITTADTQAGVSTNYTVTEADFDSTSEGLTPYKFGYTAEYSGD